MLAFPSQEWLHAWVQMANDDADFQTSGRGFDGAIGLVIGVADSGAGRPIYVRLAGSEGHWDEVLSSTEPGLVEGCLFVVSGSDEVWRRLVRQQLDPLRGIVTGKVRVRGQLSGLLRWSDGLVVMTRIAGQLATTFPGEQPE